MKKVLFITSEAVPFAKTGGLADVSGSLPRAFNKKKYDVRVIMPKYGSMFQRTAFNKLVPKIIFWCQFYVNLNWRRQYAAVYTAEYEGVQYYFIDNDYYFGGQELYGEMEQDSERFAFFAKAALEAIKYIDWVPDILHCNDWETGLVPVFLHTLYGSDPFYREMKTVYTIHNLNYQGKWDIGKVMDITGLPSHIFTSEELEFYGCANYMKGGIVYADAITTVSPSYANDITTKEGGAGLDGILSKRKDVLYGILNGIDYKEFNPETDPYVYRPYNSENVASVKPLCKEFLQKYCQMPVNREVFTIGMVTRLTSQKGMDLVLDDLDFMLSNMNMQFYIIGSGDKAYSDRLVQIEQRYPNKIHTYIGYSEEVANLIYSGCDAFLMPSMYEPCGLSQIIAMRYGTLPIVRETGGLRDTVLPYNQYENTGTGFTFLQYDAETLLNVIKKASDLYYYAPARWIDMQVRAMKTNYTWEASARKYEDLYDSLFVYPFDPEEDEETDAE